LFLLSFTSNAAKIKNNFIPSKFCANYLPDGNDGNSAISSPLFHLSNKIFNNLSNKEKNKEKNLMTARTSS